MDADLQDDPKEMPAFVAALRKGLDVVSGWKRIRHDPWHKVWPSRVFNFLVSQLTGVWLHDHNCGMKGYRTEVFREVRLYGELHRFIPVLAAARGFEIGEIIIQQGEPATALFLLVRGRVSVIADLPGGGTRRLTTCTPGMLFGEMAIHGWLSADRSAESLALPGELLNGASEMRSFFTARNTLCFAALVPSPSVRLISSIERPS